MLTKKECLKQILNISDCYRSTGHFLDYDCWVDDVRSFNKLESIKEREDRAMLLVSCVHHSNKHYDFTTFKYYLNLIIWKYIPKEVALEYLLISDKNCDNETLLDIKTHINKYYKEPIC